MSLFTEEANIRLGVAASADIYAADPTSDRFDMTEYEEITFAVHHGAGATGTAIFTVTGADNAAGDNPVAIPYRYQVHAVGAAPGAITEVSATGYTIVAGANQLLLITVKADELPDAKPFIALTATEVVDSPVAGCIMAIMTKPRYTSGLAPAALA